MITTEIWDRRLAKSGLLLGLAVLVCSLRRVRARGGFRLGSVEDQGPSSYDRAAGWG